MPEAQRERLYDQRLILERADRARARSQRKQAVRLYREALALDRSSVEIHDKLAPLLAASGQHFDAWNSYRALAHAALRAGRDDRAIAVYREATHGLPREIQAWQSLARLLVRQSEDAAAVEALIEGSRQFRADWNRPEAIHLLRRARAIAPWHFDVVVELAGHLSRSDQKEEARLLLEGLAPRCEPHRLARLRAAQLAVNPGPRGLWRWLSSALRRRGAESGPDFESQLAAPDPADDYPPLRAVDAQPEALSLVSSAEEDRPARLAP